MIIAHHLIWTGYGWWLPNDPRGSTSHCIRSDVISQLGDLHHGRKKLQPASREIRAFYEEARKVLQHQLLTFGAEQVAAIAQGFREAVESHRYTCYACAIMPDHVHVLIRKHKHRAEEMITNLQDASLRALLGLGLCPSGHPLWGGPGWKVFLDHPDEVRRTIRYIAANPVKQRMTEQKWGFVSQYDGWPLHPGHNPNSPYAKRRRGEPF